MAKTKIQWTDETWNPVVGCTKISAGCQNCYAERMAVRLQNMRSPKYADGFAVRCHEDTLEAPLRWSRPRSVFVNSMSDLFHEEVPLEFIGKVFSTMRAAEQHSFQVLTKRSKRLAELSGSLDWPENVWAGVSVESGRYVSRIDDLRRVPAALRFVSFEPLLDSVGAVDLTGIGWAIVGGESGPGAREMQASWAREIRDASVSQGVPFFFKQWGGNRSAHGADLDGEQWHQMPDRRVHGLSLQEDAS